MLLLTCTLSGYQVNGRRLLIIDAVWTDSISHLARMKSQHGDRPQVPLPTSFSDAIVRAQ